jgi:ferritin-like metal-binding protein YciE
MFERLNTPEEAYNWQLGSALTMEQTVHDMLGDLQEEAQDENLKQLFQHHQEETRQQIANLERVFSVFGWDVEDSPCPAIKAIEKEGKANIKKTDDSIVDSIILAGAGQTEHHEIAVYENLITNARAMGRDDVAGLLQENLEIEEHTLQEVKRAAERVAAVSPKA